MSQPVIFTTPGMRDFAEEVDLERQRQFRKFGDQRHPLGTGGAHTHAMSEMARNSCQAAADEGRLTWRHIISEEYREAMAETDAVKLREELIQLAAVCQAIIYDLPRQELEAQDEGAVEGPHPG